MKFNINAYQYFYFEPPNFQKIEEVKIWKFLHLEKSAITFAQGCTLRYEGARIWHMNPEHIKAAHDVHLHTTRFLFVLHRFYIMPIWFSHVLCYIVYLCIITIAHLYIFIILILSFSRLIATTANVICLYPERL